MMPPSGRWQHLPPGRCARPPKQDARQAHRAVAHGTWINGRGGCRCLPVVRPDLRDRGLGLLMLRAIERTGDCHERCSSRTCTRAGIRSEGRGARKRKEVGQAPDGCRLDLLPRPILPASAAAGPDPVDMNIVLVIAAHWWKANQLAFPSKKLIADTIGKDPTTVRRRLAKLEKDGMIERILRPQPGGRHNSNEYRLTGLIAGAEPLAKEEIAKRAEGKTYRKARAVKKGRGLVSVVKP